MFRQFSYILHNYLLNKMQNLGPRNKGSLIWAKFPHILQWFFIVVQHRSALFFCVDCQYLSSNLSYISICYFASVPPIQHSILSVLLKLSTIWTKTHDWGQTSHLLLSCAFVIICVFRLNEIGFLSLHCCLCVHYK